MHSPKFVLMKLHSYCTPCYVLKTPIEVSGRSEHGTKLDYSHLIRGKQSKVQKREFKNEESKTNRKTKARENWRLLKHGSLHKRNS